MVVVGSWDIYIRGLWRMACGKENGWLRIWQMWEIYFFFDCSSTFQFQFFFISPFTIQLETELKWLWQWLRIRPKLWLLLSGELSSSSVQNRFFLSWRLRTKWTSMSIWSHDGHYRYSTCAKLLGFFCLVLVFGLGLVWGTCWLASFGFGYFVWLVCFVVVWFVFLFNSLP